MGRTGQRVSESATGAGGRKSVPQGLKPRLFWGLFRHATQRVPRSCPDMRPSAFLEGCGTLRLRSGQALGHLAGLLERHPAGAEAHINSQRFAAPFDYAQGRLLASQQVSGAACLWCGSCICGLWRKGSQGPGPEGIEIWASFRRLKPPAPSDLRRGRIR